MTDHPFKPSAHVPISCAVCGQEQRFHATPDGVLVAAKAALAAYDKPERSAEGAMTVDEALANVKHTSGAFTRPVVEALAAEVERLRGDEAALEELRHAYDDMNPKGKTIVDFLNVWLDQERERRRCAESALAALERERDEARKAALSEGIRSGEAEAEVKRYHSAVASENLARLQAESALAALRQRHEAMTQAVGMATTIKGDMAMRADDPIGMMQEVCAYVDALRQRHAEKEAAFEREMGHAIQAQKEYITRAMKAEAENAPLRTALEAETARAEYVHGLLAALRQRHAELEAKLAHTHDLYRSAVEDADELSVTYNRVTRELRQRHADTEGLLTHWQNRYAALEAKWDALRERHAEAVEQAWKESWQRALEWDTSSIPVPDRDAAWLASEARAALERREP